MLAMFVYQQAVDFQVLPCPLQATAVELRPRLTIMPTCYSVNRQKKMKPVQPSRTAVTTSPRARLYRPIHPQLSLQLLHTIPFATRVRSEDTSRSVHLAHHALLRRCTTGTRHDTGRTVYAMVFKVRPRINQIVSSGYDTRDAQPNHK